MQTAGLCVAVCLPWCGLEYADKYWIHDFNSNCKCVLPCRKGLLRVSLGAEFFGTKLSVQLLPEAVQQNDQVVKRVVKARKQGKKQEHRERVLAYMRGRLLGKGAIALLAMGGQTVDDAFLERWWKANRKVGAAVDNIARHAEWRAESVPDGRISEVQPIS